MKTDLETQLRKFASGLEASLPEIDVDDIQQRISDRESHGVVSSEPPSAALESEPTLSRQPGTAMRGPLVAAGTAILVLIAAVVPLILARSGDTNPQGPEGDPATSATEGTEPRGPETGAVDEPVQPFAQLPILEVETIRITWGDLTADCMVDAGYPEFRDINLGAAAAASSTVSMAPLSPAEFGPTTLSEARQSGYDPTRLSPNPTLPKIVETQAESLFSTCRSTSWSQIGPNALETISQIEVLANDLHNKLREQLVTSPAARQVFIERTECLADEGYPVEPDNPIMFRPEPETAGITFGGLIPSDSDGSSDSLLGEPTADEYQPTAEEVDLAVADFHCRQQIDHFNRLVTAAIPIQEQLIADHSSDLQQLGGRLTELAEAAGALQAGTSSKPAGAINIIERDGLTLSVTRNSEGLCLDVTGAQGRAGGCGTDLNEPLVFGAGGFGGRGFVQGWAPSQAVRVVITLADGSTITSEDLVSVDGFEVQFFLEEIPLEIGAEVDLPIEVVAFDAANQQIATFTLGDAEDKR